MWCGGCGLVWRVIFLGVSGCLALGGCLGWIGGGLLG